jgi:hypothetical protein
LEVDSGFFPLPSADVKSSRTFTPSHELWLHCMVLGRSDIAFTRRSTARAADDGSFIVKPRKNVLRSVGVVTPQCDLDPGGSRPVTSPADVMTAFLRITSSLQEWYCRVQANVNTAARPIRSSTHTAVRVFVKPVLWKIIRNIVCVPWACGSVVVKALCYKPEGRGFETR